MKSDFNEYARHTMAELYDLHRFESNAECFEFIDSLLADIMHLFWLAKCVEGGVHGSNPIQRESNAANE